MDGHDLWHVAVLGSTLFGAAGLLVLLLAPLLFEAPPPGLSATRRATWLLIALAGALLLWEWLGVH